MPIEANVSGQQQITASVSETQVDVSVSGGIGPTGPTGPATTNASLLSSGTVPDERIAANIVRTTDPRLADAREWSAATATQAEAEAGSSASRLAFSPLRVFQAVAAWWSQSAAKAKLDGVSDGATANQPDSYLLNRANHTGTQSRSTVSDFAHAQTHATGGSDALSPLAIGAATVAAAESLQLQVDGKAAASHTHPASAIVSGTISSSRLPTATTSIAGAIVVGTGLSVSSGVTSVSWGSGSTQSCRGDDPRLSDSREWSASTVTQADAEAGSSTSRFAFTPLRVFQAIAAWWMASSAKTKLDGIASGATANATDAQLRDRSTHTGTQTASTISDFTSAVIAAAPPTVDASLLTQGTLSASRLPASGVSSGTYTSVTVDATGRVTAGGTHSVSVADVSGLQTALDGKQAAGSYAASVHTHGISDVTGLQTALDGKATPGDVTAAVAAVVGAAPASLDTLQELAAALSNDSSFATTVTNSLAAKAPINNPTFTGTVSGITKGMVGLGNVDNTSDASKPVSTAQAAADSAVASAAAADATSKANAAQAAAVQRANHTGTQTASTISDFSTAASAAAPVQSVAGKTGTVTLGPTDIGAAAVSHTHTAAAISDFASAVAAASPEEVVEFLTPADFPATGNSSLLYIATDDGRAYRWVGSQYAEVGTGAIQTGGAVRSDTVGSTSYIGRAVAGSATSASVWTIRRTVLTSAGAVSATTTATNVKWDDRLTASYS